MDHHLWGHQVEVAVTPLRQSPPPEMMDMAHAHPATQVNDLMVHLEERLISARPPTNPHMSETASVP